MTARGAKTAAALRTEALIRLAAELSTERFRECDWGGRHDGSKETVAFRKQGGHWLALCEHHATGPNVRRPA